MELQGSCDVMGKAMVLTSGSESRFCCWPAVWTWATLFTTLGLRFFLCTTKGILWPLRALTAPRIHYFIDWIGAVRWNSAMYVSIGKIIYFKFKTLKNYSNQHFLYFQTCQGVEINENSKGHELNYPFSILVTILLILLINSQDSRAYKFKWHFVRFRTHYLFTYFNTVMHPSFEMS